MFHARMGVLTSWKHFDMKTKHSAHIEEMGLIEHERRRFGPSPGSATTP